MALVCAMDDTISIHAPREGCDELEGLYIGFGHLFQSTHPVRCATRCRRER